MRLAIKVSTGKNKFHIKQEKEQILVDVKSNPESGKANLEIIKEFKKLFKKEVRIVLGQKNRHKIIEIDFLEKEDLNKILNKLN